MRYKGFFRPTKPDKYKGDPTNIIYRSLWEFHMCTRFDKDQNVIWWSSEEVFIPYYDPTRSCRGRYFPDFLVHYKNGSTIIYEVKPKEQTIPPVNNGNKKRFIKEQLLFAKNMAKWESANKYAQSKGYKFHILTEDDIFVRKKKKTKNG